MPGETVSFGKYRCEPPDKNDLSTYVSETIYLLSGYPVSFLKKGNVRFIMFCSHLFEGSIQPGGIPNGISGVLVMDTAYTSSISAYCGNFHHELYHMIDYAEDRTFADTKWAHLNATDFTYGKHGKYHRNASRDAGSGINGFITEYAMAAVEEDKAEIFRFLMDDRGTIDAYAQRDPVLEEKIDALKERLVRFCPDMNNL